MILRAAVWKIGLGAWVVDSCPADEYDSGVYIHLRAHSTDWGNTSYFTTHTEAIAYAHDITHKEQK